MHIEDAVINITKLRLRTFIGINPDEVLNRQDVVISVEIHYPADKAKSTDNMDDALNYRTITKKIIDLVENGRFSLLEKITSDVLVLASDHPWVSYAKVRIDKPHALRFADSVSLTLACKKDPS